MSLPTQPLDAVPLWVFFLLIFGILLLATELGFRLGRRLQRRDPVKDTAIGPMVAATLGLVGFLLAFMVSMAADRYNTRRGLVLDEADVIGTTYLRAGYLPEPIATDSRKLLREYVDLRLVALNPKSVQAAITRSDEIQVELWRNAEALVKVTGGSDVYALYLEGLNQMIEIQAQREIASLYTRVPLALIVALLVLAFLGMFILGFNNSYDGRRSGIALVALVLVFASVLYLIVDLDRSREGLFQVSTQPIVSLQQRIGR